MTITTLAGLKSGLRFPVLYSNSGGACTPGAWSSMWVVGGIAEDTTLNGVVLTNAGQIPFSDPASGAAYVGRLTHNIGQRSPSSVMLCDRLWHNGGINITSTGSQGITSPTWPARDSNGATLGDGVLIALEVSSGTGSGTPTITLGYTNSAGTAGRTGTNVFPTQASMGTSAFLPIGLQSGDAGVRSVQSVTLSSSWTSGTINLVAFRMLGMFASVGATMDTVDAITLGMPRLYNGSSPFTLAMANGGTAIPGATGQMTYAFG